MARGESAEPIYTLLEELELSPGLVLTELIYYMSGDDIKDFVDCFRHNHNMAGNTDEEVCMECQESHDATEHHTCDTRYFSSLIPEC